MSANDSNRIRLRALIDLHDLSITDVAKVGGCSRPMLSRILHEGLDGGSIWSVLEKRLPEVIAQRRKAFFQVEAVSAEKVHEVVAAMRQVA